MAGLLAGAAVGRRVADTGALSDYDLCLPVVSVLFCLFY
jgi:hypothetical protein